MTGGGRCVGRRKGKEVRTYVLVEVPPGNFHQEEAQPTIASARKRFRFDEFVGGTEDISRGDNTGSEVCAQVRCSVLVDTRRREGMSVSKGGRREQEEHPPIPPLRVNPNPTLRQRIIDDFRSRLDRRLVEHRRPRLRLEETTKNLVGDGNRRTLDVNLSYRPQALHELRLFIAAELEAFDSVG
jgi:hypothetical protein